MMLGYLVMLALIVGFLRGGRIAGYAKRPLRLIALPLLAFAAEALYDRAARMLSLAPRQLLPYAVCAQYALLLAFVLSNRHRRGIPCLLCGIATNLLVISLNGFRMPVDPIARQIPSLSRLVANVDSGRLAEYMIADHGARLLFLGDVIRLPLLPGGLASVGDFLLGIGAFLLVMDLMLGENWFQLSRRRRGCARRNDGQHRAP